MKETRPDGSPGPYSDKAPLGGDPIGYHLREALRLLADAGEKGDWAHDLVADALDAWELRR